MKCAISTFLVLMPLLLLAQMEATMKDPVIEQKVDSLINLMSLEEKVGQLVLYSGSWEFTGPTPSDEQNRQKLARIRAGYVGGMLNVLTAEGIFEAQKTAVENSRLGIPMIFGYDVIHGYQTMMPIPLAQSASWDPEVARLSARYAAREATAAGLNWTFAPMIDITRDARWGRFMESPGEDPFLASVMAKAWVEGFQGDDLSDSTTMAACAKHLAGYGFAEAGRDYNTVDMSLSTLYNVVLPPFKAASEAGIATFMNAFNEVNGVPATASPMLQRVLLKAQWDFDGFVVSDWGTIGELITHGFAADTAHAAELAIQAGSDMDMEAYVYETALVDLVRQGQVPVKLLDDAVRRVLRIKFQLGLFEDPYRYCDPAREETELGKPGTLAAARDIARRSMVLLKNEQGLLPIGEEVKSIAIIGQLAGSKDVPLGSWRAQAIENSAVSLLEGVQTRAGADREVRFAQGYQLTKGKRNFVNELTIVEGDTSGFEEAINLARQSDLVIIALGEDCWQSGEGRSQADIGLKGSQVDLLRELLAVNKNVVVVLMNGRPLAIPYIAENAPAILEAWHLGSEAGNAIAEVLFGDYNPSGKLPASMPRSTGQLPIYYNHKNTGRPEPNEHDFGSVFWSHYTDESTEPLYPFGFGLSYTNFEYGPLQLSDNEMKMGALGITASVEVRNTGARAGKETVQLYIRDLVGSVTRPVKELKGFRQVELAPGESQTVTFEINEELLSFYRRDLSFGAEPGAFIIMVGANSEELQERRLVLRRD